MDPLAIGARRTAAALLFAGATACAPQAPPTGPEELCIRACETRVAGCTPRACRRGCNLAVDRLLQREGDGLLACVSRTGGLPSGEPACSERVWARCATLVGPYADGGPPAPPPPRDFEDEGE